MLIIDVLYLFKTEKQVYPEGTIGINKLFICYMGVKKLLKN